MRRLFLVIAISVVALSGFSVQTSADTADEVEAEDRKISHLPDSAEAVCENNDDCVAAGGSRTGDGWEVVQSSVQSYPADERIDRINTTCSFGEQFEKDGLVYICQHDENFDGDDEYRTDVGNHYGLFEKDSKETVKVAMNMSWSEY